MKSNSSIISALIVAVGIVILGFCLKAGIDNIAFRDREVTVRGLAEREVPADLVTWPISYSLAGNSLPTLYDQVSANNATIVKFLTSNGISPDEISVNPPDSYDATSNRYRSDSFSYNYSINCTVTVTTKKVDKVRELLNRQSELLKEGIAFSNSYINYQFTGLNKIKPEMIAEATKNARAASLPPTLRAVSEKSRPLRRDSSQSRTATHQPRSSRKCASFRQLSTISRIDIPGTVSLPVKHQKTDSLYGNPFF